LIQKFKMLINQRIKKITIIYFITFLGGLLILPTSIHSQSSTKYQSKIAFVSNTSGNWELWVMDANGDNKRQLTYTPIDERSPSISPDGKKIVYTTNAGDIWIVNVMTKQTKKLNLELKNINHCRFSPDGKRIIFTVFHEPKMDDSNIWIVDINGVNLRKLVDQRDIQLYPDFHLNGKKIIYSSTIYAPFYVIWHDLWVINLDGTGAERILCNDAANIQAKWSPDGKKIVFASNKTGNMEIWLMDIESKKLKQLTYNPAYDASPCWSPDGEYICFISNRCGKMGIWIMDKNGKNLKQLTKEMGDCKDPDWGR